MTVSCLGAGLDPGLTSLGAMLWKGFLLSTTSSFYLSLESSFKGCEIDGPLGFFAVVVLVLVSLYLSKVDLVVP